jgi:hypothetical protein
MGWASANPIFDETARKMIELKVPDEIITEVLSVLIDQLQQGDWDTEGESLGDFQEYPAIVEAFRRHDIIVHCGEQPGGWCELERGHEGDEHKDWHGNVLSPGSAAT